MTGLSTLHRDGLDLGSLHDEPPMTGTQPDLLQDACRALSIWLASRPDAMWRARQAAAELAPNASLSGGRRPSA